MPNRLLPSLSRSMILIALGAIFGFLAVSSSPAMAATARLTLTFDRAAGTQPVPISATVVPADATGTLTFKLDQVALGPPVPIVAGAAQSVPVDIPDQKSFSISVEYSGDANYEPVAVSTIYDVIPEAPPPASAAPTPVRELVRTGNGDMTWTMLLAAALLGLGFALVRAYKAAPRI
jgi:hypothetical protein